MELVSLDGYTEDDKIAIARDFLLPRQLERAALTTDEMEITDEALREIAANYTREPGVRQLERLLAKALRKAATKLTKSDRRARHRLDDRAGQPARTSSAGRGSPRRRTSAPRCPEWPPGWPSPGWAATCCSSKPAADAPASIDPASEATRQPDADRSARVT